MVRDHGWVTDPLAAWRSDIDDVDGRIIELIVRRQATSTRIQQWRQANGGGPVDPTREEAVLAAYEEVLGGVGRALAASVLDCCRSRL